MLKTFWIVLAFLAADGMMAAHTQTADTAAPGPSAEQNAMGPWPLSEHYLNATVPLNRRYVTSTGQTVPRPSVSQDTDAPRLERKIKDIDGWTGRSICSNC